ncbi:hypothetical protein ACQP0C_41600 (plasmid) [Nocardia sp. CA-129566]|uniref:hypothetical protein n=1 Tax=Nocardia sp. CA-129566 TaxID=3239976 RepID=UPI003D983FAF
MTGLEPATFAVARIVYRGTDIEHFLSDLSETMACMPEKPKSTHTADALEKMRQVEEMQRHRDVQHLIKSASGWMGEAMNAWSDDDYGKVALLAPLAVEHLGKAVLWKTNPVLVVPLSQEAEASLVKLATTPSLTDPKLRTVGLKLLLNRIEAVTGALPLNNSRRNRMVEVRNGAMHIASSETSRHILTDSLTLCNLFLEQLESAPELFYGDHRWNVKDLVAQGRSDVQHRVAQKLARARRHLTLLEERLGETLFQETTERLQDDAAYDLDDGGWAVDWACPECGSHGRITGPIDLSQAINYDCDPDGPDDPHTGDWEVTISPTSFSCNVCRLTLAGADELLAGGLPAYATSISTDDLGPDFDPAREAERLYGIND